VVAAPGRRAWILTSPAATKTKTPAETIERPIFIADSFCSNIHRDV
jgi:hypothetical protein